MDSRFCFQTGHPLGFAVQLRLTPELKQALINARAGGDAVSLRFREEPNREAILSIAGQEYFFSTAPQAGQVEVVEVAPKSKGAVSIAGVKQRLTLQRTDADARSRSVAGSLTGGMPEDRRKRSAVLLDSSRRAGMHPRVTTTTEVVTRAAPPSQPQPTHATAGAAAGRLNGVAGGSLRPTGGGSRISSAADGSQPGVPPRKPMELPKPRSLQPGGVAPKPQPLKPRKTPTPPPPELGGSGAAAAATTGTQQGADGGRPGGGSGGGSGSGGGGGSSPVGYGSAAAGGSGGGGGSAIAGPPAATAAATTPPAELPRAAVLAARRGDLPLAVAALLREQPLTASSLQSRIDAAYRAAGQKPEAREYVKRVIDNCCTMSANRMHLKPDVLLREGPRLDELVSGTSPTTAGDTPSGSAGGAVGGGGRGRPGPGQAGGLTGAAAKRMASCSPDPRLSPDQDPSPPGPGGRSQDDPAASGGTAMDDDDEQTHQPSATWTGPGTARGARHGAAAGAKRQRTGGAGGAGGGGTGPGSGGQPVQQQQQRQGQGASGTIQAGRSGGGLQGYDDFDDLADPPVAAAPAPAPAREVSGGRAVGATHVGRAAAVKASAASRKAAAVLGAPRGLPSFATGSTVPAPGAQSQAQQSAQPHAAPPRSRQEHVSGGSLSPAAAAVVVVAPPKGPGPARAPSDDAGGRGAQVTGGGGGGGGSENTDGRGAAAPGTAAGAASPDYESVLDPEVQPYADVDLLEEDKDAELYRSYVDWKPEPHAAVQSYDQFKDYEREYRAKFEVYHRLNQKYNEVVREADAQREAVESARDAEERRRCVMALWRLGASKWRLLEVWKHARRNLHLDLGDLRDRVTEFLSRQGASAAVTT